MNKHINLGKVVKGSEVSITIELDKPIQSAKAGCGVCTKLQYIAESKYLTITYKAVDKRGIWVKGISILYEDNSTDRIQYLAEVV